MNTKREFNEIKFDHPDVAVNKQILQKFGSSIKKAETCKHSHVDEKEFTEVLNLMPQLETLRIQYFSSNEVEKPKKHKMLKAVKKFFSKKTQAVATEETSNEQLNLPKLRSLFLDSACAVKFFAEKLPANLLEEFHLNYDECDELDELLEKQQTIRKLFLPSCYPKIEVIQQLNLTHLRYSVQECFDEWQKKYDYLSALLSCQPNLIDLNLMNYRDSMFASLPVDNKIFEHICKMKQLETLNLNIDNLHVDSDKSMFADLKNLKSLQVMSYDQHSTLPVLEQLSLIENCPIECFINEIWYFEVPAQTYLQMGQNFPFLKKLKIMHNSIHKINFFLDAFPNMEELDVYFNGDNDIETLAQTFNVTDRQYPKIKAFKIFIRGQKEADPNPDPTQLKALFPNVTQFQYN